MQAEAAHKQAPRDFKTLSIRDGTNHIRIPVITAYEIFLVEGVLEALWATARLRAIVAAL